MAGRRRRAASTTALLVAAAALSGRVYADPRAISSGSWTNPGNWSPAGVPTDADDVTIAGGIGSVVSLNEAGGWTALSLTIATSYRGRLDQRAGHLAIGDRMTLGLGSSSLGEYTLFGGSLHAGTIVVGDAGGGFMLILNEGNIFSDRMIVAGGPAGAYEKLFRQYDSSVNNVSGDLEVGFASAGSYENHGGYNYVKNLYIGGPGSSGTGTYRLFSSAATLSISGIGVIGGGSGTGMTGTLANNGGTIVGSGGGLQVLNASGRLYGAGTYDIPVLYVDAVNVRFDKNTLTQAAILTESAGYNAVNTGVVEYSTALAAKTLPSTAHSLRWGASPGPANVAYKDDAKPTLEVHYNAAHIAGLGDDIPAANIEARLRMIQFGAAITKNNASPATFTGYESYQLRNISQPPDKATGLMFGKSQNIAGNFDIGVFGIATRPVHQDPNIELLHQAPYNLSGKGVIMGDLEASGPPHAQFGAFDDWTNPDPSVRRISSLDADTAGDPDAHATRVASIMVGYDPLGIQVDGQSNFPTPSQRYNGGFGFTGVAPQANLVTKKITTRLRDDFNDLTSTLHGKATIVNISAYNPDVRAGSSEDERWLDGFIERRNIITTVIGGDIANNGDHRALAGTQNAIVVGNAQFDDPWYPRIFDAEHASVASSSPTSHFYDSFCRPHIVAQGTGNLTAFSMEYNVPDTTEYLLDPAYPMQTNSGLYSTSLRQSASATVGNKGTSYSAPTVAGVAALMVEMSRRRGFADAEHPLVVKSILMTSAIKPPGWQRGDDSEFYYGPNFSFPLDFKWGAGLLNPVGSVDLVAAGEAKPDGSKIRAPGWDLNSISDSTTGAVGELDGRVYLLHNVAPNSAFAATLNWYRHIDNKPEALPLSELFLELWSWDGANRTFVAKSDTWFLENLEHIWVPNLPFAGDYLLQVGVNGTMPRASEDFGIAWDFHSFLGPSAPLWDFDGGGSWTEPTHWNCPVPNGAGAAANFFSALTIGGSPAVITLDGDKTIGQLSFENNNLYQIAQGTGGTLILDNGGGNPAQVNVVAGSHQISAPVQFGDHTQVYVNAAAAFTLTGPVALSADKTLAVRAAGPLRFTSGLALGAGSTLKIDAGALFASAITGAGSAEVAAGATLAMIPGSSSTSTLASLTLAGATDAWTARLDLADNNLILNASAGDADSVLQRITSQIRTARANGTWLGNGITSSIAAADATRLTGLAVILNDWGDGRRIYSQFAGEDVDTNSILVKYTWNGDMDLNGKVDADDYFLIDSGFLSGGVLTGYRNGDLDYNHKIDADDYFRIDSAYLGQDRVMVNGAVSTSPPLVPEPTGVGWVLAGLGLLGRRRLFLP